MGTSTTARIKFILKSLSIEMLRRTESEIGNGLDHAADALEVFSAVISLHSVLNDSTELLFVDQLIKLKLVDEPGENVMTYTDTVLGLARHINGISTNTKDLHTLIYNTMIGSSNAVFSSTVSSLLSACINGTEPAARNWESKISMLRVMYRNLVTSGKWEALKHTKETHEPQGLTATMDLESLKAEVQRLTTAMNHGTTKSGGQHSNWTPTCHGCGEQGHIKPNCPHRINSTSNNSFVTGLKRSKGQVRGSRQQKRIKEQCISGATSARNGIRAQKLTLPPNMSREKVQLFRLSLPVRSLKPNHPPLQPLPSSPDTWARFHHAKSTRIPCIPTPSLSSTKTVMHPF
jgi:hypothetical protein